MSNLELSFAMIEYDRVMPLISGDVQADGIDLYFKGMPGSVPRVSPLPSDQCGCLSASDSRKKAASAMVPGVK